jgi:hypothetical protein
MTRPGSEPARTWVPASMIGGRSRPIDGPSSSRTDLAVPARKAQVKSLVQGESACKPATGRWVASSPAGGAQPC